MTALAKKPAYDESAETGLSRPGPLKTAHASAVLEFIQLLMRDIHPRDFAIRLWDGTSWDAEGGHPTRFTLTISSPGALKRMLRPPLDISLGESYAFGDFDVEGDYYAFIARLGVFGHTKLPLSLKLKYLTLPSDNTATTANLAAQLPSG